LHFRLETGQCKNRTTRTPDTYGQVLFRRLASYLFLRLATRTGPLLLITSDEDSPITNHTPVDRDKRQTLSKCLRRSILGGSFARWRRAGPIGPFGWLNQTFGKVRTTRSPDFSLVDNGKRARSTVAVRRACGIGKLP
jgi:hypothetical protein